MDSSPLTLPASISEPDSLSDSDWLDIASNQGSSVGNDDSGSELDRDDELSSMPLSRTSSSISLGSSHDSEIDAWEGFVDDRRHHHRLHHHPGLDSVVPTALDTRRELEEAPADISEAANADRELADDEDMRVRAALDQSMVSTLSASRSSSSPTAHNSFHELMLSFPDPLSSSKDELTKSYERIVEEDTSLPSAEETSETVAEPQAVHVSLSEKPQDITPSENTVKHQLILDRLHNVKFEISLYGNSSSDKWSFVEMLLQKMAAGGGWITLPASQDAGTTRWFSIEQYVGDKYEHDSWIVVHDRTGGNLSPTPSFVRAHPSLAIIYLPSFTPPALPRHSLYLPVFVPLPSPTDPLGSGELARRAAQDTWDLLDIPTSKVLRLKGKNSSALFDSDYIRAAEPRYVYLLLQHLVKKPPPGFSVALVTILSLILGVIMNSAFRTSAPTPTTPTTLAIRATGQLAIQTAHDVVQVTRAVMMNQTSSVVPSSLKDFALAVISPSTTSLSVRRASVPSVAPSLAFKPAGKCGKSSTLAARRPPQDVIVRPSSSISPIPSPSQRQVLSVATNLMTTTATSSPTSLSIRLSDSLSQIYGDAAKAVVQVVSQDVQELMDALDALLQAIGSQTTVIIEKSKDKAKVIRQQLNYRNARAKKRARELRDMGDKLMTYAGERLVDRASQAKRRARKLKDSLASSGALRACWKAHEGATGKIVKELSKHSETIRAVAMAHAASKDKILKGLADKGKRRTRIAKERARRAHTV